MNGVVALPLLAAILAVLVGAPRFERLQPAAATRSISVALVAVTAAAIPTLWLVGFGGLARIGVRLPLLDWCERLLPEDQGVGLVVGVVALGAAVFGTMRAVGVLRLHRRVRSCEDCPLQIIDTDAVFAYTLPGPAGTIAVSRGLRESLVDEEFAVVVAHEESHARHRHDRFLLIGLLAAAVVPPLASLARRLEFHIERWADEDALDRTGIDRTLAARTIARVGLAGQAPAVALGIARCGVAERATALLQPVEQTSMSARAQASLVLGVSLAVAMLQLHHTAAIVVDLLG